LKYQNFECRELIKILVRTGFSVYASPDEDEENNYPIFFNVCFYNYDKMDKILADIW
jgi:hypothetical protein